MGLIQFINWLKLHTHIFWAARNYPLSRVIVPTNIVSNLKHLNNVLLHSMFYFSILNELLLIYWRFICFNPVLLLGREMRNWKAVFLKSLKGFFNHPTIHYWHIYETHMSLQQVLLKAKVNRLKHFYLAWLFLYLIWMAYIISLDFTKISDSN